MSITDELREWAGDNTLQDMVLTTYPPQHAVHGVLETLLRIADRIDEEHERACREQFACGAEHGIGASIEASMLQDHGYIVLPRDADGEYVYVGDVMEDADGEVFTVSSIDYGFHLPNRESAAWMLWSIDAEFNEPADQCRHHHEPTVEDVLREFAHAILNQKACYREQNIAEYAAKLRLMGAME